MVIASTPGGLSVAIAQNGLQFNPPVGYSVAANAVAIADLNGDKKPDVITASASGSVSVLLGNGDGTLRPAMSTPVSSNAQSLAVADFNGDQKLDVAVAAYGDTRSDPGGVAVLLGKGDGTFQAPLMLTVNGLHPVALAAGDLNGDGKLDLAVLLIADFNQDQPATVAVLLGQGNGTFAAPRTFQSAVTGSRVGALSIGDLNGDGKPDLVMISPGGSQGVDILLGDGSGNFRKAAALPTTEVNPGGTILGANGDAAVLTLPGPSAPGSLGANTSIVIGAGGAAVTGVSTSAPAGTYGTGAVIPIAVTFNQPVIVTGTPLLALNSRGSAPYTAGSESSILTFTYTVAAGQHAAKLDATALSGGAITDNNSNPVNLTLSAPGAAGSLSAATVIAIRAAHRR